MHRLSILLLLAAACGGSSPKPAEPPGGGGAAAGSGGGAEEEGPVVGPPQVAWKDMTEKQRGRFMGKVVMPTMKPLFQTFDPKGFKDFDCETCHGEGAKKHTFKMPNPDIFVLPGDEAGFAALAKEKGDWMKFMATQVKPQMAKLLDMPEFDPAHADKGGFGCFACHTHKEEAGAKKP